MTAQGHPRTIFKRAIEHGNVVAAEATARELGRLSLEEALRLLFLYAEKEPIKFERAALRWLAQYVTEGKAVSLPRAHLALAALSELRAAEHEPRRSSSRSWCGVRSQRVASRGVFDRSSQRKQERSAAWGEERRNGWAASGVVIGMPFRYRLIDAEGTDLGPFVSRRGDWKPGEWIGRSKGEDMVITAVIEPEESAGFHAYLVVSAHDDRPWGRSTTR